MSANQSVKSVVPQALASCRRAFTGVGGMSLVINLLLLTGPLFMLQVYDRVLTSRSVPTLVALGSIVVALFGFMWILDTIRARMLTRIGQRLDAQLTGQVFSAAITLPVMAGRKGERIEPVSDLDRIRRFLSGHGPVALFDMPWIPLYLGVVFLFHPLLGMLALTGAVVIFGLVILNEVLSRSPSAELARHAARRNAIVTAGRANAEAVVAMGMVGNLRRSWIKGNAEFLHANRTASDRIGESSALIKAIRNLLQSAVLGVGAYLAIGQEITPGIMIAASIITARALAPVELAVGNWRGFIAARQGAKRLAVAIAMMPDEADKTGLPAPHERLDVANLTVAPVGEKQPVVRNVNFQLRAGDGLGIIGPSGSGKSSLARALVGVWRPLQGDVRLDGAELDQWTNEDLGRSVGYLPQDIELFEGTIAQNIARFDPQATSQEVMAAARIADAHDLITGLAQGYETVLGEAGATLSGGQQQRVALARALFRKPFLVVLDEPNSNLDIVGERALTAAIKAMRAAGSIVIVVAHRASAVAAVDTLLRLDAGAAVDYGPKKDVLERLAGRAKARKTTLKVVTDGR